MNLKYLETFLWVVRLGGFSAAAARMNTTQATVSHRIKALEQDLGAPLFDRDGRAARLTATGLRATAQAEEMLRLGRAMREAAAGGQPLRGAISIGVIDSIVYTWLPRFIERLRERYPLISLDLTVETSLALSRPVQEGAIDLAMMMGPVLGPAMRNEELCTYPCSWLASRALPLPDGALDIADLVDYPLLAYPRNSIPYQALMRLLAEARISADHVRVYNTNSIATLARLVRDGIGICAMPAVLMRDDIARGEVRCLSVRQNVPPLSFHAVYRARSGNPLAQAVAALAGEVAAAFDLETYKKFQSDPIE